MPQLAPERVFELERVFIKVKSIDVVTQVFNGSYYLEFRVRGGAKDPDFFKGESTMTKGDDLQLKGEDRKVVPSVMWYLQDQVRIINAWEFEMKECKAIVSKTCKDDLACILRCEGEFQEEMELFHFPLDFQHLQFQLEMQCAIGTSPFPVKIIVSPEFVANIDVESFNLRNIWDLNPEVTVNAFEHNGIAQGAGKPAQYPAMNVAIRVTRQAAYYVYNIVAPMGLFSLLSITCPFAIAHEATGDRLGIALTLVLTAAAYKFAISQMVPTVSYLTLMDRYVLEQAGIIALVTVQNCIFGTVSGPIAQIDSSYSISAEADLASLLAILAVWVLAQLKFAYVWRRATQKRNESFGWLRHLEQEGKVTTVAAHVNTKTDVLRGLRSGYSAVLKKSGKLVRMIAPEPEQRPSQQAEAPTPVQAEG